MDSKDKRSVDFLAYIGIALLIAAIIVGEAYYAVRHNIQGDELNVATILAFVSIAMFGMLIRDYRPHVRTIRFWIALLGLVLLHIVLMQHIADSPRFVRRLVIWALLITVPEYLVFTTFLSYVVDDLPRWKTRIRR